MKRSASTSTSIELDFYPYEPEQKAFVLCQDHFTAFIGGIGSGKSWAGALKGLMHCQGKETIGLVVAPTYRMLRDATFRSYQQICGKALTNLNKSEFVARVGPSEVFFRSADNPDRLRGPNIDWAHIDEAALCPRQTWEVVIGRLRGHGKAGPCWLTSTPKGRNWVYEIMPQLTVFKARTRDNPHLAPEFVQSLEQAYTGDFARQELEGEFVSFEGLVYDEFSRDMHVLDRERTMFRRFIAGVDEGYTNPAVILVIGLDGDGRAHVCEEFYRRRVLQGDFVAEAMRINAEYHPEAFYVDPSAAGLIADLAANGLPVVAADHVVQQGIQVVKARLQVAGDGRPRLTIAPECANTIAEFESYVWKETRLGIRDEPEKMNDHAMDALRYAMISQETSPIPSGGIYVYEDRITISPY